MKPEDKSRLKKAFQDAIARSSYADDIVDGVEVDGQPVTQRTMVGMMIEEDGMYNDVDQMVASGKTTYEKFVTSIERSRNFRISSARKIS